jgi:hypothetical protein
MAEYIPAAIAFAIAMKSIPHMQKPDQLARTKLCNDLQEHYGKERMLPKHYNYCLQYGSEYMMGHFGYEIPVRKIEANSTPRQ